MKGAASGDMPYLTLCPGYKREVVKRTARGSAQMYPSPPLLFPNQTWTEADIRGWFLNATYDLSDGKA